MASKTNKKSILDYPEMQGSRLDVFTNKLLEQSYDKLEKGLQEDSKNNKIRTSFRDK